MEPSELQLQGSGPPEPALERSAPRSQRSGAAPLPKLGRDNSRDQTREAGDLGHAPRICRWEERDLSAWPWAGGGGGLSLRAAPGRGLMGSLAVLPQDRS